MVIDEIAGATDRLDRRQVGAEPRAMTDELLCVVDEAASEVEFIGFETASFADEPLDEMEVRKLPVPARPRRRRVATVHRRAHPVRVMLDDDEFLKLNVHAKAQGVPLPDYVRRSALRDPRLRFRQVTLAADDLFAPDKVIEMTAARGPAPLPPGLERRINAYFLPEDSSERENRRPAFPQVLARLGHFVTGLIGPRWSGHRAMPPAGT
jgi:hypothetical protein